MKPARIDWNAFNNEEASFAIAVTFADSSPFDWSQYSAIAMQVKADPLQPEADLALSLGAGLAVRDDDHSILDGVIALADLETCLGLYVYDVVGTNAGDTTVVVTGTIMFSQGVTR